MSAEDRLKEILRSEASTLVPAGDGLARIRERVVRRRRTRLLLVPVGALTAAGAVVAVLVLTGSSGTQQLQQNPIGPATQPPSTQATVPAVPPTKAAVPAYTGPALWPFTSSAQGDAWKANHGAKPWAGDPLQVAQHFVSDFLHLTGISAVGTGATIDLRSQGRGVGMVRLVQISDGGPWTVVSVGGTDLTVTSPQPTQAISSPTAITGRVQGVDENVQLQLIGSATARVLGSTTAPAGSAMPWQGSLSWSDQTWFTAAIVAITRSLKDGSVTRITAIAVKRGH